MVAQGTGSDLILPGTSKDDLLILLGFLYTGFTSIQSSSLTDVLELARSLGISSLVDAIEETLEELDTPPGPNLRVETPPSGPNRMAETPPHGPNRAPPKRAYSSDLDSPVDMRLESDEPTHPKQNKLAVLLLQSILTQLPLTTQQQNPRDKEQNSDIWGLFGLNTGGLAGLGANSNLANLLSAAAKLKQVADKAMEGPSLEKNGEESRKLAFHEPRPCPICRRMYRDAATLRTHTAIMHSLGKEPFKCSCGVDFVTKYEMYQHKKTGHPPVGVDNTTDKSVNLQLMPTSQPTL